jgi:farnesyl diphosphate synthase
MQKKLNKIAIDTNNFLKKYLKKQNKTDLIKPMSYGLFSGGKKIRSKIIYDIGSIFKINYRSVIHIGAAVECIHAYSLIHDDLPCMDDDDFRRGKLSTHKKFGESTAVLAGNSLLTLAFEILSDKILNINDKKKNLLINSISKCSGHEGVAGGQFSDLNFEKKKISLNKIIDMQIKKTGKLFSFCCLAPVIVSGKFKEIKKFEKIGEKIGLLFQIADDLIDYKGTSFAAGKKTQKDKIKGKATLLNLFGYQNTVQYATNLKEEIFDALKKYDKKSQSLKNTINFILKRNK